MKAKKRNGSLGGNYTTRWSKEEDTDLINGWLQNSTLRTNWEDVAAYVNKRSPNKSTLRIASSCRGRWNYLYASVGKFVSAMTEARSTATDGMSEMDIRDLANKLYWEDTKCNFSFAYAYELLHAAPRFLEAYSKLRKKDIFDLNVTGQSNEGSSKRLRSNREENYSVLGDSGAPELGDHAASPLSATPVREGIPDEQFMLGVENLKVPAWNNSSQVFGDDMIEVKLQEIQAKKEIEERRLEFEREKAANQMHQKNLDRKCIILEALLGKKCLSPAEEVLRDKLFEELCYN